MPGSLPDNAAFNYDCIVGHTPPCVADTRSGAHNSHALSGGPSPLGPPFLFEDGAHRIRASTSCQVSCASFAVKIDRELAAVASAVRAIPECLPRNALDKSPPSTFAADVSPYSDHPGGVVAPLAVATPKLIALITCAGQRGIPETNRRLQRRALATVTTIGKASNSYLSPALHLHQPRMGPLRRVVYSVDMMQAVQSCHVVRVTRFNVIVVPSRPTVG